MRLRPGTAVGHYEILQPIGAGGMGEVYRARDTRLGREVALKILPGAFEGDPDRLARFRREATTLASLNHPHIAHIHGVEEAGSTRALVMELVEGEDLAHRLRRGAIPVAEALEIAHQVAEALEAAHQAGVVHRDLKPANVRLRPDGTVKVLDFGLAKAVGSRLAVDDETGPPTESLATTKAGVVLGTAAYMAPEQAMGRDVDRRADVWAFGCLLFELLSGSSCFGRATASETLAAVLEREPEWAALPATIPDGVRRLLSRCLRKEPKRRLHDIADARIELEDALASPAEAPAPRRRSGLLSPAAWLWVAAAALLAVAVVRLRQGPEPAPQEVRVHRLTDLVGLEEAPALSPDGRSVAFTAGVDGRRQIFVQLIAGGPPLQLTRDPMDHRSPRWSPDSSSIVYSSPAASAEAEGTLWEIPALGGAARRVAASIGGADVNPLDGRLAFFRLASGGIELVTASPDGSSIDVVGMFEPTAYHLYPRWSPDGASIAFQRGDSIRFDVFVVAAAGGQPRRLTTDNNMIAGFAWLPDASGIVYSSSRGSTMAYLPTLNLWEVALRDASVRQLTWGETSLLHPDVSRSGAVVASRMRLQTDIWKYPADGPADENVRRATRVTRQTGQVLTPTAAPGDKEVAFLSDSGGHANLWVVDLETGSLRQITHERDPGVAIGVPVWSPDGRSIAFVSTRDNVGLTFGVWLVDPDGGNLRRLANPGLGPAWSHDGRSVYYSTRGAGGGSDVTLMKVPAEGGRAVTVTTERLRNVIGSDGSTLYYTFERPLVDGTPEFEIRSARPEDGPFRVLARISPSRVPIWQIVNPALSPDGLWLAQALTDGFTTNVWALSTSTGEWRQITDFGSRPTFIARRVSWSGDGRSILAAVSEGDADVVMLEGLVPGARD